jgi:hypothetical protein
LIEVCKQRSLEFSSSKARHSPAVRSVNRVLRLGIVRGVILCLVWLLVFVDAVNAIMPEHPEDTSAFNAMSQSSSHVRSLAMLDSNCEAARDLCAEEGFNLGSTTRT